MPASSAAPPEILADRYLIGKLVGTGSSGAVYLARDRDSGRRLAVKIREAKDSDQPVRFIAEAQAMSKLRSPRLVHVEDSGQTGNLYWFTMPYYDCGSLRDRVRAKGPTPAPLAMEWTFQILEGLVAVHDAQLVHRDVKPHNVLLDEQDNVLLTDFGLIRHVGGGVPYRTRTDQSMGTPNYRAPEQAANAAHVDHRADIYGVGANLYFLLTGKLPGFLYMVDADDPVMEAVPEPLRAFILQCMAYKPEERFPDARTCAEEVARIYDTLPEREGQKPMAREWLSRFDRKGGEGMFAWLRRLLPF
jgi:eukaryotic-like serine/threonine-protein kinase